MGKLGRLARIGRLTGRVATSMASQKLASLFQDPEVAEAAEAQLFAENAERIVESVGQLKGAVMKVGQSLALAAEHVDLPEPARRILGRLHDDVEPIPFEVVRQTLETSLEMPLQDAFATFDVEPLGTASLGQVHRATLEDGREVVVKVLHDGIETSVDSDLGALKAILSAVGVTRSRGEMNAVFAEIRARLEEELDYLAEAANLVEFARRFAGDDRVRVPSTVPERSTERVLTMDRLPGVALDEFEETGSPEAKQRAGLTLVDLHYTMAFRFRVLHADPHPGNYLFEPDGRVSVLDFGCVKRFDAHWIGAYARALLSAIDGDRAATLDAADRLGVFVSGDPATDDLAWRLAQVATDAFRAGPTALGDEQEGAFKEMSELAVKLKWKVKRVKVPPDLLYLHRSMAGIYTLAKRLGPVADWAEVVRPHLQYAIDVADGRVVED